MSFRAEREILLDQIIEKIRFLPTVEMTDAKLPTFYESIKLDDLVKSPLSCHSREGGSPEMPEKTGFPPSRE